MREGLYIYFTLSMTVHFTNLCKTDWKQIKVGNVLLLGEGIASLDSTEVIKNIHVTVKVPPVNWVI